MKMKAADFSKIMLIFYQTAQCHVPEQGILDMKHLIMWEWSSHGNNLGHLKCQNKKNLSWWWKQKGSSEALVYIYTSLHSAHPIKQLLSSIFTLYFALRTFLSPF